MHLKTLTLKGFKSFASATTLHFEPGITAVVGPNGSGKSNVVDALAWVMGEQGAKSLRGGKMEDVIFSGTTGRAPLGRAEVALTIDNTDGALPIDFTEVTIARTLFRNGGSEYSINGEPCRLLDVQELLSDSGIGREMHVIIGQGQLDAILKATPEERRGFVEEAAGVLKHRKRKEKALRKLDAMAANLTRLQDLTAELRRQLKPLGRQAEVARRAVVIQSDVRDARLRVMADDLVGLRIALEAEVADETALRERAQMVDSEIAGLHAQEAQAEQDASADAPALAQAQETWFALSGLRERFHGLEQLASERVRNLQPEPEEETAGRDPEQLDAEARSLRSHEFDLGRDVERLRDELAVAETARARSEEQLASEERRITAIERAAADRREGLATLSGHVQSARTRVETRTSEIERLDVQVREARARSEEAQSAFHRIEVEIAGLDAGEMGLDAEHESASRALAEADTAVEHLRAEEADIERQRAATSATIEALEMGMRRHDAAATVMESDVSGVLGTVASLLHVDAGAQTAVAAALGDIADAVVVRGVQAAVSALVVLKERDAGRGSLVVVDSLPSRPSSQAPMFGRRLADVVHAEADLGSLVQSLLGTSVLVDSVDLAAQGAAAQPEFTWVTRDGDVFSSGLVRGGSASTPSLLEVQTAYEDAQERLVALNHRSDALKFDLVRAKQEQSDAAHRVEAALSRLHESDAQLAAIAEQLGHLGQTARAAASEADRLVAALQAAQAALVNDQQALADLQDRLQQAQDEPEETVGSDSRESLAQLLAQARQREVDSRLAVRTAEERVAAVAERAAGLERDAQAERAARAAAIERRERRAEALIVAQAILAAARVVSRRVEKSAALAQADKAVIERRTREREENLTTVRTRLRALQTEADQLRDSVHRDEVARAEQRLRIEQLETKVLEDFGIESDVLIGEYGPDQLVPPSPPAPGDDIDPDAPEPEPYPYVRAEQERRLRTAEKALALLGKINPLALEEYSAMEERHRFLSEQLDDLKRSRDDLMEIVREVDERVQQVFSEAYADVEREFEQIFGRLFPGGEGRLILTDPANMLTTGIDVEARPPGKRVKRLSLLSGGERSLTAVAFLVALFKARPSPFYVLDEVEAALDDVNLGRLIDIIEELRSSSQLIVITHQKRTMEVADALYGVSMRGDGVTQVIGQRLRESA